MSPRVTVAGEPNREGRRSESESEQGETRVGRGGPEAHASYRERVTVEKVFDELRIGAKDLSSWVIAGSLRNAFRGSLGRHFRWV